MPVVAARCSRCDASSAVLRLSSPPSLLPILLAVSLSGAGCFFAKTEVRFQRSSRMVALRAKSSEWQHRQRRGASHDRENGDVQNSTEGARDMEVA